MTYRLAILVLTYLVLAAEVSLVRADEQAIPWNVEQLMIAPAAHPAEGFAEPDAKAVFLEGLPYQNRPTRFFAWYGVPKVEPGKTVPAMVLVHGGGGTAHLRWVRQWNARGYAAIAIDTSATMPTSSTVDTPVPNPLGGPKGSDWCFTQIDDPVQDQWAYHAVANIMLAHSFLRELSGVDADRIGLTGISWGGYLTAIVAGVDSRFRFAVPVYGCGYLADDSAWTARLAEMGDAQRERWQSLWDPANYLPAARMPMLWINGDMDLAFSLKIMRRSFLLPKGERYISIQPDMPHGHTPGEAPPEIPAFAEQILHDGRPLARCTAQGASADQAWANFQDVGPQAPQVRFAYTRDAGKWMGRKWTTMDANWDSAAQRAHAPLPSGATACYFVITDDRGLMTSSDVIEITP